MPCGYCSGIGHTMRHCNSDAAQNLLASIWANDRNFKRVFDIRNPEFNARIYQNYEVNHQKISFATSNSTSY